MRPRPILPPLTAGTLILSVGLIAGQVVGTALDGRAGDVIGVIGLMSAVLLILGQRWGSDRLVMTGQLWLTGVWASVGAVILVNVIPRAAEAVTVGDWWRAYGVFLSALIALIVAWISAAAWWAEHRIGRA